MSRAWYKQILLEGVVFFAILIVLIVLFIPRFENAQLLSSIAQANRDMRTIGNALLQYGRDRGEYPPTYGYGSNPHTELAPLLEPVAYLTEMPTDPFRNENSKSQSTTSNYDYTRNDDYKSTNRRHFNQAWLLGSLGPDLDEDAILFFRPSPESLYDPSNGILSSGDLLWSAYECDGIIPVTRTIRFMP